MAKARMSAEQREEQKTKREGELADLRAVLNTVWGRRFFWRLVSRCGPMRSAFDTNALVMAHSEGERNIGRWLWAEMEASCPEAWDVMRSEAKRTITAEAENDKKQDDEA